MEIVELLLLVFLGIMSYLIVRRTVTQLADTPIALLWLALMSPPIVLVIWGAFLPEGETLPFAIVLIPFLVGGVFYSWLVRRGRQKYLAAHPAQSEAGVAEEPSNPETQNSSVDHPLTTIEENTLRTCFPWGVFYLQSVDYRPQAILCRGRLATNPDAAYARVHKNIESNFGDRFLLIFQEGQPDKPFFALVPNPLARDKQSPATADELNRPWLAFGLLLVTLFTTTMIGTGLAGMPLEEVRLDPGLLQQGLSYSVPLLAILGVHELSHYFTACYYKVRATLPYFVPIPFFLGTFGAFIQIRSPMPHRRALFDVAIAGPLGSFILSLPLLLWGLSLSGTVDWAEESSLLNFNSLDPRFSFFLGVLSKLALGSQLSPETVINLHPLAIAGYLGIIVTALNLMPVGQLDGGHIVHAMFGQRKAIIIGQVTRLLMVLFGLIRQEFLLWALLLLLMPTIDEPALNDVTELDNRRDVLGFVALTLLVVILLPMPPILAGWLAL